MCSVNDDHIASTVGNCVVLATSNETVCVCNHLCDSDWKAAKSSSESSCRLQDDISNNLCGVEFQNLTENKQTLCSMTLKTLHSTYCTSSICGTNDSLTLIMIFCGILALILLSIGIYCYLLSKSYSTVKNQSKKISSNSSPKRIGRSGGGEEENQRQFQQGAGIQGASSSIRKNNRARERSSSSELLKAVSTKRAAEISTTGSSRKSNISALSSSSQKKTAGTGSMRRLSSWFRENSLKKPTSDTLEAQIIPVPEVLNRSYRESANSIEIESEDTSFGGDGSGRIMGDVNALTPSQSPSS